MIPLDASSLLSPAAQVFCMRLTETLLHVLWQGSAIGLLLVLASPGLRRLSPRLQYGAHAAALLLIAICAVATFLSVGATAWEPRTGAIGQASSDGAPTIATNSASHETSAAIAPEVTAVGEESSLVRNEAADVPPSAPVPEDSATRRHSASRTAQTALNDTAAISPLATIAPYAAAAYLLSVALMLTRLVAALWGGRRLRLGSTAVEDECVLALVRGCAQEAGLRVPPVIACCQRISVPVVLGVVRPLILLPAALLTGLTPDQLRAVVAHELAHIRRYDLLLNLLQRVVEALLFFHPAVWYLSRRMTIERENCCDDLVVSIGWDRARYADALIRMAELCTERRGAPGAAQFAALAAGGDRPSQLKRRVLRILGEESPPLRLTGRGLVLLVALIALLLFAPLVMPGWAKQPQDSEAARENPERDTDDGETAGEPEPDEVDDRTDLPARALREFGNRRLHQRSSVHAIAFSPDSHRIASSGLNMDSGLRIWDVATGRLERLLKSPDGEWLNVDALGFTPDGRRLIAGHGDGRISIWNPETGERLSIHSRHEKRPVQAIAVSPDGRTLVTGGADGRIRSSSLAAPEKELWSHSSGEGWPAGAGTIFGNYGIMALTFTPDGERVIAGVSKMAAILVLEAQSGRVVGRIEKTHGEQSSTFGADPLNSISLTRDGGQLISGGSRYVARGEVPLEIVHYSKNIPIAQVRVWDLASGEQVRELTKDRMNVGFGYTPLSPDGRVIALSNFDEMVLLDRETGAVRRSIRVPGWWGRQPVFSPDGKLVAAPLDNTVGVWEVESGRQLHVDRPGHQRIVVAVDYTHEGQLIATGSDDGRLHVWEANTGRHRFEQTLGPDSRIEDIEFSRDGQRLAICGQTEDARGRPIGMVVVWSPDGNEVSAIPLPRRGKGLALSPDGERAVAAHSSGSIGDTRLELWSLRPRRRLGEFPRDPQAGLWQYETMRFSPDGRYILIAESNGTVTQWDTSAAAQDMQFIADWRDEQVRQKEKRPWMANAAFTPDGTLLVTSTKESIYVWDVASGKLKNTITVPTAPHGFRLGVAADNRTLAASQVIYAGFPGVDAIRLFDIPTGRQWLTLEPDDDRAFSFAFSPGPTKLVTGLTRGTAVLWDLH